MENPQPDFARYTIVIDGSKEPDRLSKGKGLHLLIMSIDGYRALFSASDFALLKTLSSGTEELEARFRRLGMVEMRRLCARVAAQANGEQPLDIAWISAEIDAIGFREWKRYDTHYETALVELSEAGRTIIYDELLPRVQASRRHSRLDFVALAKDHPQFVQHYFAEGCSSLVQGAIRSPGTIDKEKLLANDEGQDSRPDSARPGSVALGVRITRSSDGQG